MIKETIKKMKVDYKPTLQDLLYLLGLVACIVAVGIIETL